MPLTIAIVDDKAVIRRSMEQKLCDGVKVKLALTAGDGDEFLKKMKALPIAQHPQVVLMDIDMPVMNGIETVAVASVLYPATRFLMLTVFDDDEKIFNAVKSGASGYLLKEEDATTILEALYQVVEGGGAPMSPRIARKTLSLLMKSDLPKSSAEGDPNSDPLSPREKEILQRLIDGYNYKRIAEELFISPNTVRNHMANIYEKLHVRSKVEAVKIGIRKKWF